MQWGVALGCSGLKGDWGEELESLSVECGLIYREGFGWNGAGGGGQRSFSIVKRVLCSLVCFLIRRSLECVSQPGRRELGSLHKFTGQ